MTATYIFFFLLFGSKKILCFGYNEVIGGIKKSEVQSISTQGGHVYLIGGTQAFNVHHSSYFDMFLTRFEERGGKDLSITIGTPPTTGYTQDYGYGMSLSNETGCIYVAGKTNSYPTFTKLNLTNKTVVWSRRSNIGFTLHKSVLFNPSDPDNILFVGEKTISYRYILISRVNSAGHLLGTKKIGNHPKQTFLKSAERIRDDDGEDGILLSGHTTSQSAYYDLYVGKLHWNLTFSWYLYAGVLNKHMYPAGATMLRNGNVALAGYVSPAYCSHVYVFNVTSTPKYLVFGKSFCSKTTGRRLVANSVTETNGAILLSGYYYQDASNTGGFLIRISKTTGSLLSSKIFYFVTTANFGFISSTNDHDGKQGVILGYLVEGTNRKALMIKLDENDENCNFESILDDVNMEDHDRWGEGEFNVIVDYSQTFLDTKFEVSDPDCDLQMERNCHACFGIFSENVMSCSGHGSCNSWDNCTCVEGYGGENCEIWSCFGVFATNITSVCSPSNIDIPTGQCADFDYCDCFPGYSSDMMGGECTEWECDGLSWRDPNVCDGNSKCVSAENCEEDSCFGIAASEITKACTIPDNVNDIRTGVCVGKDTCVCFPGYSSLELNGDCTEWNCNKVSWKNYWGVCSGRGDCVESERCTCRENYLGVDCETWSCDVDHKEKFTCSGKGKCISPNVCECRTGYSGKTCEKNMMYFTVMMPILGVFGSSLLVVGCILSFFLILCLCVCFFLILFVTFVVSSICLVNLIRITARQKRGIEKFSQLRNFDLLLKEQELDDDDSIAHLRINRSLFEIPYDEIAIKSVIGSGGSQSIVFLAEWAGETVAFKCFKTRMVMGNQNDFDNFEREVEILSSLNHPNIIRFYGASIKPPRIGIVMEFCSNGELFQFFQKYKIENDKSYPINEKIRVVGECVNALTYCHSRNIIHRDLKCENVLVNSKENCKLMDFGLSKVVENSSQNVNMTKTVGTSIYMAPEVVISDEYNSSCDVFSFAILLFVIITENQKPYGKNEFRVEFKVANDAHCRPNLKELDDVLKNRKSLKWIKYIIKRCWNAQPELRLGFKQIAELFKEHLENVDHSKAVLDNNKNYDKDDMIISSTLPSFEDENMRASTTFHELNEIKKEMVILKSASDEKDRLIEDKEKRIIELEEIVSKMNENATSPEKNLQGSESDSDGSSSSESDFDGF